MHPRSKALAIASLLTGGVIALVHLLSHVLAVGEGTVTLTRVTQWLLMPSLALLLWASTQSATSRLVRLVLLALFFSWLGDFLPGFTGEGDAPFLTMVGGFLLAQITYIAAFVPFRERSFLRTNRVAVYAYLCAFVALVYLCAPGAGALLIPVVVYGVVLTVMAVLASGLGRIGALGGALFFVSDAMIAIRAFAPDAALPSSGLLVMTTYIAAQALLVAAVLEREGSRI